MEKAFGETAELIQGSGGIFEVERDGKLIYSKKATGRFPEDNEVISIVKALDEGVPLEQAQAQAAANASHTPSFGEWLGRLIKRQ